MILDWLGPHLLSFYPHPSGFDLYVPHQGLVESYVVNTKATDSLPTQGAWTSAAMVLTSFSRNIPVAALDGLHSLLLFCIQMNVYVSHYRLLAPVWFQAQSI